MPVKHIGVITFAYSFQLDDDQLSQVYHLMKADIISLIHVYTTIPKECIEIFSR